MRHFLFILPAFFFITTAYAQQQAATPAYEPTLTLILEDVLTPQGAVHYDKLTQAPNRARLREVLQHLERFDLKTLDAPARKTAFWINAYNALMLHAVAQTPARTDVLGSDNGARFFKTPHTVGGVDVTLDQIENVILRRQDGPAALKKLQVPALDPRIHVALNCAAVSCPRLRPVALTPGNLDAQLDAGMRDFVNSTQHFRVENGAVEMSSLLDWFGSDFDRHAPAGDYLLRFMSDTRPEYAVLQRVLAGRNAASLKTPSTASKTPGVRFVYDWTINRASPHR